jgi:hypothetical protein
MSQASAASNGVEGVRDYVARKVFGLKWAEETGEWRKLRTEELHNL